MLPATDYSIRWSRYHDLPATEKTVIRLKALIGSSTTKTVFVTAMVATGTRAPDGKPWSAKALNPMLDKLRATGLLDENLACDTGLLHPVAAEAAASPEGERLIQAVQSTFPADGRRPYYSYTMQTDEDALRRLRLAIYANDEPEYARLLERYNKDFSPGRGRHVVERLFLGTPVSLDWLAQRAIPIQHNILVVKLSAFLQSGVPDADLAPILSHYRARQDEPAFQTFRWDLLQSDLLAGNLADAGSRIATIEDKEGFTRHAFAGTVAFLSGRNDEAIAHYRESLKLHRKHSGKRKLFLSGSNGLFCLLALLRANQPDLQAEIQTGLDAVAHEGNRYSGGFQALQALLWLVQGLDPKARQLLQQLRAAMPDEPLSGACIALAEFVVDAELARANRRDTAARFAQVKDGLPLVARIQAEVLARVSEQPEPYESFLANADGGRTMIRFTDIVHVRQPWERAFDHLASFLRSGSVRPAAVPTPRKAKRLAWFLDPATKTVEVLEQAARGADGWTAGRTIAMKRLHEQDPRLDYLTDHDRRALRTIRKETHGWYNDESFYFEPYRTIPALIGHPAVFDLHDRDRQLELVAYPAELVVTEQRNGYRFTLSHGADEPAVFLEAETPTRYRVIDFSSRLLALQEILGRRGLTVPRQARERVIELVRERSPALPIRAEIAAADLPAVEGSTVPVVQLQPRDEGLKATMVVRPFGSDGPCYVAGQGGRSVLASIQGQQQRAHRNLDAERAATAAVVAACPTLTRLDTDGHEWLTDDLESSLELLLELRACPPPLAIEWPQGQAIKLSPPLAAEHLSLRLSRARDWFQLRGEVQVDEDLVLDMQDLLERLDRAAGRFVPLDDGRFLALTRQFQQQLERLRALSEAGEDGRRLHPLGTVAVQDLIEAAGTVTADHHWQELARRIRAAGEHAPQIPLTLQAELRDYQVEGFAWLSRLAHWGAGACLADDMGLGKTVQAIAVLLEQAPMGPCLVVAPTSVCHNWEAELARFAPTLAVHRLAAAEDRAVLIAGLGAGDVLVASYGLLHQEAERLAGPSWRMVVFDEAQALKNAETKRAQASQRLDATFRLALTGTPIENYLDELWSLFNTITPGLLGSKEAFQKRFATPIERDRAGHARQALRALIRPFILRRTKSAVLSELPPRTERIVDVDLPEDERAFYEALRRTALETLGSLPEGAAGQRKIHILAAITRLRRACCHPGLIDPHTALSGAKLELFLELVDELIRNRHKALVFSQFVGHLERVRGALEARGVRYQYLDGSTPARQREQRVAAFQAGEGDLFLISLKAGGVGLNLTAADYVIHLDPWWNPAVEDQASDRAHRIGQQRPVTVYRLVVQDSIEEQILHLHRHKRDLAADLLEGAEVSGRLSEEDLIALIRHETLDHR
jgi:superfamily II DNA or RNA helicase